MIDEAHLRDAVAAAKLRLADGGDLEDIILDLRRQRFSFVPFVLAVRELQGIGLGEAKTIVHAS